MGDPWGEAMAIGWRGVVGVAAGDLDGAADDLTLSVGRFRAIGDDWALGLMLGMLARLRFMQGRLAEAGSLVQEVQSLGPALTHWHSEGDRLQLLAEIALQAGDLALAHRYLEEAMALYIALGNGQLTEHVRGLRAALPPLHLPPPR